VLMSIDIGYLYIMGALGRLGKLAYSLKDQPSNL